jgi:hypothetical protein
MGIDIKTEVNGKQIKIYSYYPVEDTEDDNIDVFVEVDGITYSGQVHSWKNVKTLLNKDDMPCYFYDRYGVVLQNLSNESIVAAIEEMVAEGDLEYVFCRQV